MTYCDFQDLPRRTAFEKGLRNIGFNIAKNPKYDGYKCRLVSVVYTFYDKKCSGCAVTRVDKSAIKSEIILNQKLAKELQKPNYDES